MRKCIKKVKEFSAIRMLRKEMRGKNQPIENYVKEIEGAVKSVRHQHVEQGRQTHTQLEIMDGEIERIVTYEGKDPLNIRKGYRIRAYIVARKKLWYRKKFDETTAQVYCGRDLQKEEATEYIERISKKGDVLQRYGELPKGNMLVFQEIMTRRNI